MDRDGFLLPLHLFGGRVYLALWQPALSLVLCNGAMSASVQQHTIEEGGEEIGGGVEERRFMSYIGPGASGGRCRICVLSVWWRSCDKSKGAVIIIISVVP